MIAIASDHGGYDLKEIFRGEEHSLSGYGM